MINYTEDPRINKHIAKLNLIEEELAKLPHTTDINEISVEHAIALDDRRQLKERIERESLAFGIKNPLQNAAPSGNNDAMGTSSQHHTAKDGQFPTEAAAAAKFVQNDRPRINKSRFIPSSYLKNFIKKEEGYRPTYYPDTAKNGTIGYGHKVIGNEYKAGDTITKAQAEKHFEQDLESARAYANKLVGNLPMHRYEFEAIVDAMYNVGPGNLGLGTDKSPYLNKAIKAGDYAKIGNNLIYSKDSKNEKQDGLFNRSQRRTNMYFGKFGDY